MSGQQFWWSYLFREWKPTAYGLIFTENLLVFFCKLPLWVYQIPSVYTANIYLIERQGYVFMLFVFRAIRTGKVQNITGWLFPYWSSSAWPLLLKFSEFVSIQVFVAFLQKYLYFGSLTTWWQVEQHEQERSELCMHQQMMWLS